MRKLICLLFVIGQAPAIGWAVPITVSFAPQNTTAAVGDTIAVDILADITDPVLGWGLDVMFDSSILSLIGAPAIGSAWLAAPTLDGDGLAGLAFPTPVSGSAVLLASLTFSVLDAGTSALTAAVTGGDLTEGFALALPGSFADVVFQDGSVTVGAISVPEPGTLLLLLAGVLALAALRLGVIARRFTASPPRR